VSRVAAMSEDSKTNERCKRSDPLALFCNSKLGIPLLDNLLDGNSYTNLFVFHLFSFFRVFSHDFIIYSYCPVFSCLNHSNCMMTSQIRSHIEYLIPTDNILVPLLLSDLMKISSLIGGYLMRFNDNSSVAYFLGPPCIMDAAQLTRCIGNRSVLLVEVSS